MLTLSLKGQSITADSAISDVTVYVDRAIVTRTAEVELPTGVQQVIFPGLPAALNPNLLQVSGSGTATASILEVRAVAAQLDALANPRLQQLRQQAHDLQFELRKLKDRTSVVQQERDFYERLKNAITSPPTADGVQLPPAANWPSLVSTYTEGLQKVTTAIQEIDREMESVQERLDAVQREINDLQAPAARTVRNVVVRLDVTTAGNLTLKLDYTVAGASWSPAYDVRVTSAQNAITLGYAAMVRQSTGEDWSGVNLVLSTARPALNGTAPELSPWIVAKREPQLMAKSRISGMTDAVLARSELAAPPTAALEAASKPDLGYLAAQVQVGLTSATFTIPYAADVPADNTQHKVGISSHTLDAKLTHLTVPKLAELAYLRANITNTTEAPLIGGPVNLFLDGTYVAQSAIKTIMPGETFDLDLGVDDGITVERKLVNRLTENTGIVSRKQKITYDILITVQNNRPAATRMVVRDQMPVSRHEDLKVTLIAPPARNATRDEDGTISWEFDLEPGAKRELPLKIAVEFPTDLPVSGLE